MKRHLRSLLAALLGALALGLSSAQASLEVSGSVSINATADFYAPLAPAGVWVDVGSYGRCWHPSGVAVGWRPYCEGEWVWTDCGWYWQSDESWAWACYHYGWWVMDPAYGWIWVPGVEWAPAWVSWRVGGGYIGWAPLAPRGVTVAVSGPEFVFIQSNHFQDRVRRSSVVVNNTTIIRNTTVINNLKQESRSFGGASSQKVMVNEGPGLAPIQKATGKALQPVSIREAAGRNHIPATVNAAPRKPPGREVAPSAPAAPQLKAVPGGRGEPFDSAPTGSGRDAARPSAPDRLQPPPGHSPGPERPSAEPPGSGKPERHEKD